MKSDISLISEAIFSVDLEGSTPTMSLAIVIVNYRTPKLVIDCLTSLQNEIEPTRHSVVVVDNASGDRSVELVEKAITENQWNQWVRVLPSTVNGGFSAGNNLGHKIFKGRRLSLVE